MKKITVSDYTLKELCKKDGSLLLFREKLSVALSISRFGADVIELPPVKKAKEDYNFRLAEESKKEISKLTEAEILKRFEENPEELEELLSSI